MKITNENRVVYHNFAELILPDFVDMEEYLSKFCGTLHSEKNAYAQHKIAKSVHSSMDLNKIFDPIKLEPC